MSETISKMWLKDNSGTKIAPKTLVSQVQDAEGTSLEAIITQNTTNLQNQLDKLGGTVEITDGNPEKDNTVLTIDPTAEEVSIYTSDEVDELFAQKGVSKSYSLSCLCDNSSVNTIQKSDFPGTPAAFIVAGYHNNITSGSFSCIVPNASGFSYFLPIFNNNSLIYLLKISVSSTTITTCTQYSGNTSLYTYVNKVIAIY